MSKHDKILGRVPSMSRPVPSIGHVPSKSQHCLTPTQRSSNGETVPKDNCYVLIESV